MSACHPQPSSLVALLPELLASAIVFFAVLGCELPVYSGNEPGAPGCVLPAPPIELSCSDYGCLVCFEDLTCSRVLVTECPFLPSRAVP